MFALVQYIEDSIFQICFAKDIQQSPNGSRKLARWHNGQFYPATVLCYNELMQGDSILQDHANSSEGNNHSITRDDSEDLVDDTENTSSDEETRLSNISVTVGLESSEFNNEDGLSNEVGEASEKPILTPVLSSENLQLHYNSPASQYNESSSDDDYVSRKKKSRHVTGLQRVCGPKRSLTPEEKKAASEYFWKYLLSNKLPSIHKMSQNLPSITALKQRSLTAVKTWLYTESVRKKGKQHLTQNSGNSTATIVEGWGIAHIYSTQFFAAAPTVELNPIVQVAVLKNGVFVANVENSSRRDKRYSRLEDFNGDRTQKRGEHQIKSYKFKKDVSDIDNADKDQHYVKNEEEESGNKLSRFDEKTGHKRGHKTRGYHNKFVRDEIIREHKLYGNRHKSGYYDKHDRDNFNYENKSGWSKNGSNSREGRNTGHNRKKSSQIF
ncbi:hypothetical protein FQA39_LY14102 [Lamprigera yunnana]|nr:hypothetical protein FQA39_LY14102 [Lamprigera yunnana]